MNAAFADEPPTGRHRDKAAKDYRDSLMAAFNRYSSSAAQLFSQFDSHFPDAITPDDEGLLTDLVPRSGPEVLDVIFELATRMDLSRLRLLACDRLAASLGGEADADLLVSWLDRWRAHGLFDQEAGTRMLRAHLARRPLTRDAFLWRAFLTSLPDRDVPDLFEVRDLLGQGTDAVRLADTQARRQAALNCCLASARLDDVLAGLELARESGDPALRDLAGRAGELYFAQERFTEALDHFRTAGRADGESECHERLGDLRSALASCPADRPDRLVRLVGDSRPEIDGFMEREEFTAAVRSCGELIGELDRLDDPTSVRAELVMQRQAVLKAVRRRFAARVDAVTDNGKEAVQLEWSRFEEAAGDHLEAAKHAEKGGDLYRAFTFYVRADRFGEADRVLKDDPDARELRAEARESGGDLVGAAQLNELAGRFEEAVALYLRAGRPAEAARCLIAWLGDEAIDDPRLISSLRSAGEIERLVSVCLRSIERDGRDAAGFRELRRLHAGSEVPAHLQVQVTEVLDELGVQDRGPFEEGAGAWVGQAREEIDARYAGIWAFDLGTTTCAVAIYDSETEQVELCRWKGRPFFASTLSLDAEGNEVIGLSGDEILASWVKGHIGAAKRRMGSRTKYQIGERVYRPEEVSARLIGHARTMVEDFLADKVAQRVAELARGTLAEVRDEWLGWLAQEHDLRLERPRTIITIPAFFRNNQKHATQHACEIAGVELVRLLHEPTAACIAAGWERRLEGDVVVVDLGAGTLDLSALEVGGGVYEVKQVLGDNDYGGRDLDTIVTTTLAERLLKEGIEVPARGKGRRRLEVAAEYLKVSLSGQPEADFVLHGFAGRDQVRLELTQEELNGILAEPLLRLREICRRLKAGLPGRPDHLVLVGGPMLSPQISGLIEKEFGLSRSVLSDPRTAVARGAALQAAVLSGGIAEHLLLDVTPLALGIRVSPEPDAFEFSTLVEANTTIPTKRVDTFTTTKDGQDNVLIEIYSGDLDPRSKVGQFQLAGLLPAPKGTPQIEVSFEINASCVLTVTARDTGTGHAQTITISDTTLLSPAELHEMAARQRAQAEEEAARRELTEVHAELEELAEEALAADSAPLWAEFRRRVDGHRAPGHRPDPATEKELVEIFGIASTDLELELTSRRASLLDLAAKTRDYLAGDADLAVARHLLGLLKTELDRARSGMSTVSRWNAVLARLASTEADPLLRFRALHASNDFTRALELLPDLTEPADLRRLLDCLAGVGDTEGYRQALATHAGRLNLTVLDGSRPEAYLSRMAPALVQVTAGADTRVGFLVSDRLVVTNRRWLTGREIGEIEVVVSGRSHGLGHLFRPEPAALDVILLRLAEPADVTPLRLGHAGLVRIGDPVWTLDPGRDFLIGGVVDGFESFPEQGLDLYKTGLQVGAESSGGPLLNEVGEVIGVLTVAARSESGAYAVKGDVLAPLFASAGFNLKIEGAL